jgi:hypothetical protein
LIIVCYGHGQIGSGLIAGFSKHSMKKASPTFFAIKILLGLMLFGMAGCSSMPHVFGDNEVPEGALNAPRVVAQPTPEAVASPIWPRTGDVPSMPNDFSSLASINQSMTQMENDRAEAGPIRQSSGIPAAPPPAQKSNAPQLPQGF